MLQNYQIDRLIGSGGFGSVYYAKHTPTNNSYAIKKTVLTGSQQKQTDQLDRIKREVDILKNIDHPNIVSLHDVIQEADTNKTTVYYVMDYISGSTLKDHVVKHKHLSIDDTINYIIQLLPTIQYLHDKNIVHRDIKPSNILIDEDNKLFLTDFGTTKLLQDQSFGLTQTGNFVGTLTYAAPEQLMDAKSVTYLSDIYSLGVTFYYMLTGHTPFGHKNHYQLIAQILNGNPAPPHTYNKSISHELSSCCLQAIDSDPKKRFQSATEFLNHLTDLPLQKKNIFSFTKNTPNHYITIGKRHFNNENYEQAANCFTKAIDDERALAHYELGLLYIKRNDNHKNYTKGIEYLTLAANDDYTDAMVALGKLYETTSSKLHSYTQAQEWYEKAAQLNNAKAMIALGEVYRHGKGVPPSLELAEKWYTQAINQGNAKASFLLGQLYYEGKLTHVKRQTAKGHFTKAAKLGNTHAMVSLGEIHINTDTTCHKGLSWLKKAASKGNTYAMKYLGDLYYHGPHVSVDWEHALEWYEKAFVCNGQEDSKWTIGLINQIASIYKLGKFGVAKYYDIAVEYYKLITDIDIEANRRIGDLYRVGGHGIEKDYKQAMNYYKHAAHENLNALCWIGYLYMEGGHGIERNYEKAKKYFDQGADRQHHQSLYYLGALYEHGYGVKQSNSQSFTYYSQAAKKGSLDAMYKIANCYYSGNGISQDYEKAIECYEYTAKRKHVKSMMVLASLYRKGTLGKPDYGKATKWYKKASKLGCDEAESTLHEMVSKGQYIVS